MPEIASKEALRPDAGSEVIDISEQEFIEWQILRPFVAQCLTLNHELAGPLAGILGYAEFLSDEGNNLTEDQTRYLVNILRCTESMCEKLEALGNHKSDLSEALDIPGLIEAYSKESED